MSSANIETWSSPQRIVCLFLAKFDFKEGYKLVWSKLTEKLDLSHIENRALPSGIHEYGATAVYLVNESRGKLYYGHACFRQLNLNDDDSNDRLLIRMYSLGVLMEPIKGTHWKANDFSAVGWEHQNLLDTILSSFLKNELLDEISALYDTLIAPTGLEVKPRTLRTTDHPLQKLPAALSLLGPLLFPVYKAALLRKNIIIFNHSSQASSELIVEPSKRDPTISGAITYLLALVSVVPNDIQLDLSKAKHLAFSQPLFTVGLQDVEDKLLSHYLGFIASTSDEILKYNKNLYDLAIIMPPDDFATCQVFQSFDLNTPVKATFNDYSKFLKVYRKLPQNEGLANQSSGDDLASIKTSNSLLSAFRLGFTDSGKKDKLVREPSWWFSEATSPMSWREYFWLAFSWFASAGTTTRHANKIDLTEDTTDELPGGSCRKSLIQLASIVGDFHKLSKKWFFVIEEIVSETMEGTGAQKDITLKLTHQDVVDMELDPYSYQDLEFLREFVLTYWDSVSEVEIGLGFGFCGIS